MTELISEFQAMSYWEYLAVLLGIFYIHFASIQSLWCWPAAFFSTMIYTLLFWQGALFLESALNFYYLVMAVYGWWSWRQHSATQDKRPIVSWSTKVHIQLIAVTFMVAILLAWLMTSYTSQKFAYLDSFTTCFALLATYMVTQKVLENWLYWVVINLASIYLYIQAGYLPTAALFVVYTILAARGYLMWQKQNQSVDTLERAHAE